MSTPSEFRKSHSLLPFDFLEIMFNKIEYTDQDLKEKHLAKLKLIEGANELALEHIGLLINSIFIEKGSFYKNNSNSISFAYDGFKGLSIVTNTFKRDEGRCLFLYNEKVEEIIDFLSAMFKYAKELGIIANIPSDVKMTKGEILKLRLGQLKSDQKYTKYLKLTPQQEEEEKIEKDLTSEEKEALNKKINEEIQALEEEIKKLDSAQQEEQVSTNISEATTIQVDSRKDQIQKQ